MGILAALLAAGLLPTANHKWLLLSEDAKATPAICILGCYLKPGPNKEWANTMVLNMNVNIDDFHPSQWFWPPIVSASFVVVAFTFRVVRLYKSLSLSVNRATKWVDNQIQRLLSLLFRTLCKEEEIYSLKRSLGYRPVFGIVMIWRFLLVLWASFALEVCSFRAISTNTFLSRVGKLGLNSFPLGYLALDARLVSYQHDGSPRFQQPSMVIWPNRPRINVGGTPHQHC